MDFLLGKSEVVAIAPPAVVLTLRVVVQYSYFPGISRDVVPKSKVVQRWLWFLAVCLPVVYFKLFVSVEL